jgi:hypothetical protein
MSPVSSWMACVKLMLQRWGVSAVSSRAHDRDATVKMGEGER